MAKKKSNLLALSIALLLVFSMLAPINVPVSAASSAREKMDSYVSFLKGKGGNVYWNAGSNESTLKQAINNGNLNTGLGTHECGVIRTSSSVTHSRTSSPVTCTSNVFGGGSQCHGFAKYFSYYLYGSYPQYANGSGVTSGYQNDTKWTYYHKDKGTASCPTLQPGDFVRYDRGNGWHTVIVHYIKDGRVYAIDCNHSGLANGACLINATEISKSWLNLTVAQVETAYKNGKAYVCRYNASASPEVIVTTNAATNITAASAQLNGSLSANRTVNITEHGAYLGTSPSTSSMTRVAQDIVTRNKSSLTMFYSTVKYGVTLQPDTMYYYYQYVVLGDGKTINGAVVSFKTLPDLSIPTTPPAAPYIQPDKSTLFAGEDVLISWPSVDGANSYVVTCIHESGNGSAVNTETTTANQVTLRQLAEGTYQIYAVSNGPGGTSGISNTIMLTVASSGPKPPEFSPSEPTDPELTLPDSTTSESPAFLDAPVIEISRTSIKEGENAIVTWENVPNCSEYDLQIQNVLTSMVTVHPSVRSPYTVSGLTEGAYQIKVYALAPGVASSASNVITLTVSSIPANVQTAGATNITATSARLNGTLSANRNVHITEHGAYLGTSTSNMTLAARDIVDYNKSSLIMFYDTTKYGPTLQPNTTYYYYQYAIVDGQVITGEIMSFTTASAVNTCLGIVAGTNGALAINNLPAASPQNSTQIGRIPEGESCTVYLDLTSGNWYWVEYNGVSGYAYKNYVVLK